MAVVTVKTFTDRSAALDDLAAAELRELLVEANCPPEEIERQVAAMMQARRAMCQS